MFSMDQQLFATLVALFMTVFGAVWSLAWWLSGKFSEIRNLVYTTAEKTREVLLNKLEYHEKHDDDRFSQIRDDLSEIRIRNAAKDTMMASLTTRVDKLA